jgi:hypothetical protein
MKFTIDGKSLIDTISQIRKVLPSVTFVNLDATDKGLKASANDGVGVVAIKIYNCSVDTEGGITCPIDALVGSVKGRKTLEFELNKSSLCFTDTQQYNGKFDLPPYAEIDISLPKDDASFDVSEEVADAFEQTVSLALLQGSFDNKVDVPLYLKAGAKGTQAMCYDEYYVVRVTDTQSMFDSKLIVGMQPQSLLSAMTLGGKTKYKLVLTADSLWAFNKQFVMRQPLMQLDNAADAFSNIGAVIDSFEESISCSVTINTQRLLDVLTNFDSFYVRGVAVGFKIGKKGVEVTLASNVGSVRERIEGTTSGSDDTVHKCELQLIKELLQKVTTDSVCLQFIPERALVIKQEIGTQSLFMSAGLTTSEDA